MPRVILVELHPGALKCVHARHVLVDGLALESAIVQLVEDERGQANVTRCIPASPTRDRRGRTIEDKALIERIFRVKHALGPRVKVACLTNYDVARVLAIRSSRNFLFRIGVLSNRPLVGAVTATGVLQLAVAYVPFLQEVFDTVALSGADLVLSVALSTSVFWAVELEMLLIRQRVA